MMNPFIEFMQFAHSKGYGEKVVGDDAYTKRRTVHSRQIKLEGAKHGCLQIFEEGIGHYEIRRRDG